jgi:microcompartment protein CcmK/EutM
MYFGRVVGMVWATVKSPQMVGQRMLVVQPLTPELKNTGKPLICTDGIGAGTGELVSWVRGKDEVHVKRPAPAAPAPAVGAPPPPAAPPPRRNSRKHGPC